MRNVDALALGAAALGSMTLLVALRLGRDALDRERTRATLEEPPITETTSTTTLTAADAGAWTGPLSGMAAHETYDPETNPVTPNAFGAPRPPPRVPRTTLDAGADR